MHLNELIKKLTSEGFFPIRVEGNGLKINDEELVFIGELEDFLKAAKVLKTEAVFVVNTTLRESDFEYEADREEDDRDDNLSNDNEAVYLPSIMPSLNKYKKYIGQDCAYKLFVSTSNNALNFIIREAWWDDFAETYFEAIDRIEEHRKAMMASRREELRAEQKKILDRLSFLINDTAFAKLPTQKAMRAYAIDKIPELEEIDETTLQIEVSKINAKLQAKGLGSRR